MDKAPKKEKQTVKKEVPVNELKKPGIQMHFGNIEVLKIKLLEAIARNTADIVRLMREVKEGDK